MVAIVTNPANLAAQTAMAHLKSCLDQRESFIFEAGAGAGKTFSLIEALRYLTKKDGAALLRNHQRIACITYTNVATNEIETRTDRHPVIYSSTIHAFCWTLIKDFQPFLRQEISSIPGWMERLKESAKKIAGQVAENGLPMMGNNVTDVTAIPINPNQDVGQFEVVGQRNVEYSLGHPRGERHSVSLGRCLRCNQQLRHFVGTGIWVLQTLGGPRRPARVDRQPEHLDELRPLVGRKIPVRRRS